MKLPEKLQAYIRGPADKYKYLLVPAVLGLALLLWPIDASPAEEQAAEPVPELELLERRMEQALAKMAGVGKVSVTLTVQSGSETVYLLEQDRSLTESSGSRTEHLQTSTVKQGSGAGSGPVVSRTDGPVYRGALVVCQGAQDPAVVLRVTEAVRALTGLPSHNIVISKMKS